MHVQPMLIEMNSAGSRSKNGQVSDTLHGLQWGLLVVIIADIFVLIFKDGVVVSVVVDFYSYKKTIANNNQKMMIIKTKFDLT